MRRYHAQFDAIHEIADPLEAIVHTGQFSPRFCRANPHDARMLTVFRHADLAADPPAGLGEPPPARSDHT